jgi:hypothetical protein
MNTTRIEQLMACRDLMEKADFPDVMIMNISNEIDFNLNRR